MPMLQDPAAVARAAEARKSRQLTPDDPVTLAEQTSAAFFHDNTFFSAARRLSEFAREEPDQPGFDPLENLKPGEEVVATRFADDRSLGQMQMTRERIKREGDALRAIGEGPVNEFVITALAILADPLTYVPVAGALGRAGSLGSRVGRLAAAGAAETALGEGVLQATQESRSATGSLLAVMMGGAFGAGLGGAAAGVAAARFRSMAAALDDMRTIAEETFPGSTGKAGPEAPESTVGAQRVGFDLTPEETELVGTFGAARAVNQLNKVRLGSPSLEMLSSRFPKARELALRLVDTGLVVKGNLVGRTAGAAVHTRLRRVDAVISQSHDMLNQQFRDFRRAGGRLNRHDFFVEVGRSMRRQDQHSIPQVQNAARILRRDVFDPLKNDAIGARLLPDDVDVKTAPSYLSRVYNREVIRAREGEFKEIIVKWMMEQNPDVDLVELRSAAQQIINTIQGAPAGRVPFVKIPVKRGPLKERTFNIPDDRIEDFLESNVSEIIGRYTRTIAADVEFSREFGSPNAFDPDDGAVLKDLQDDIDKAVREAQKISDAEGAKVRKEGERMVQLASGLAARVRGVRDVPLNPAMLGAMRVGKAVRTLNYLRLLGSVMLSSIPDAGRIVMEEGLVRSVGTILTDMTTGFKGIRMAKQEANMAGTALDMSLSQRINAIADLGERYASETQFERGLDAAGRFFGQVTLLDQWNTMMKSITSAMAGTRILAASRAVADGTVDARDLRKLAVSGINEEMARKIAAQSKHFERNGFVTLGNTAAWTDQEAVDAFRNALLRDVDNTIITPNAGDAPLWTTTEWGKMIFQFKRFSMAATNRILLSGLQARDMATLNGVLVMVALGGVGTALRDLSSKGEVRDRSVEKWVVDSVDRSGAAGIYFELESMFEKPTGISPSRAFTGEEVSRFQSRDVFGQLLGPSAGAVTETIEALRGVREGDFTQSDLHKIRKLVPGQNLFYLRYMIDQLEEGSGLPKKQSRKRRQNSLSRSR